MKLQRYDRKDYTELVEFPVEIVGRDGVVRRYTFEDSIRLYQRRITFAQIRYRDADLVRAEVNHCRARIGQLRRSYFHRYGWGTPEGHASAEESFGDLAGELAAFLCRVLGVDGRPELRFEQVADELDGVSTWYVMPGGATTGMLLYFHRFEGSQADAVRDAFFASLKHHERTSRWTGDAERQLAYHYTVDCGFVLTGRGADYASFVQPKADTPLPLDLAPSPWDEVLDIVRKGDYEAALRRCRELTKEQPWHRSAYVAGAMLASWLGDHDQAEDLALVGARYFPQEAALHQWLGVSRIRLGRVPAGEADLRHALELAPDLISARGALALHLASTGRTRAARGLLAERPPARADDRRADAALTHLSRGLLVRQLAPVVVLALGVGAALLWALDRTAAPWPLAPGLGEAAVLLLLGGAFGVAAASRLVASRTLDGYAQQQRQDEIGQGLRRLQQRRSRASND